MRQEPTRQYSLGPRLLRLADRSATRLETLAHPYLSEVVAALDETVNLAVLDGEEIVYIAQVQPAHNFMRMFTQVGRHPHPTAVGKAMLAEQPDADVLHLLNRTGMQPCTGRTITSPREFLAELATVRERGYALDDGEQELGVRCIAVAVRGAPRPMALSVTGPVPRMSDRVVATAVPILRRAAAQISAQLGQSAERSI